MTVPPDVTGERHLAPSRQAALARVQVIHWSGDLER